MFLCCPSSLVSKSKATFSKTSGVCSFHNTGIIDDDLVVVLWFSNGAVGPPDIKYFVFHTEASGQASCPPTSPCLLDGEIPNLGDGLTTLAPPPFRHIDTWQGLDRGSWTQLMTQDWGPSPQKAWCCMYLVQANVANDVKSCFWAAAH